ncbi:DUF3368 domain-containing protein [Thermoflexus hugenholtzii]|uniref:Predicted nucleic acid-binding protein, contains PIN domain n=1 Tax=Thermoflexus hugenholtzii JAD2 TaxID=877466 RepID=A0A212QR38_9CHLR|nr:DUF3368 domain-containing protein [Thermoflexus hugenholtzii]SNB61829.1 Predicted nucleic acid-binding protein, contains PIN domain [Thermoflexus hugenholtzii JAD2]
MIRVVVDSTPLIALSFIGRLDLLKALFDEVLVPASVYQEVVAQGRGRPGEEEVRQADWLVVRKPEQSLPLPPALLGLDRGEVDVILLAQEVMADWVLIDERLGRKIARALGLQVKGTLGVLLAAYHAGFLSRAEAEEAVDQLANSPIRISSRLAEWFKGQLSP